MGKRDFDRFVTATLRRAKGFRSQGSGVAEAKLIAVNWPLISNPFSLLHDPLAIYLCPPP
jgi:hypothetical protein